VGHSSTPELDAKRNYNKKYIKKIHKIKTKTKEKNKK